MNNTNFRKLKFRTRFWLIIFVLGLAFGSQMFFFVTPQITWLNQMLGPGTATEQRFSEMSAWIHHLYQGITDTYTQYPFMAYCMDWLAFAQLAFMVLFVGAVVNPQQNIWLIKGGMIICWLHILTALGCGTLRGIPFFWQLLDGSFGILGFIVLYAAYKNLKRLVKF